MAIILSLIDSQPLRVTRLEQKSFTQPGPSVYLLPPPGATGFASVLRIDAGVSLMPVGLEKNITVQQMADLISYIKNWRYLNGRIPIDVGRE